jgi:hypothetical protein
LLGFGFGFAIVILLLNYSPFRPSEGFIHGTPVFKGAIGWRGNGATNHGPLWDAWQAAELLIPLPPNHPNQGLPIRLKRAGSGASLRCIAAMQTEKPAVKRVE